MDIWKFFDYNEAPFLLSLSLTAWQWGLEEFPGNTVGILGSWHNIQSSRNGVEAASPLPYSYCDSNNNTPSIATYNDIVNGYSQSYGDSSYLIQNITSSSNICQNPLPCATDDCVCLNLGCRILIEGIGQSTAGPSRLSISSLALGISFILAATIAVLIILGSNFSAPAPPSNGLTANDINQYYTPPDRPSSTEENTQKTNEEGTERKRMKLPTWRFKRAEPGDEATAEIAEPVNMAKEVARATTLLREMYTLDIHIYGLRNAVQSDVKQREEEKLKVNALFAELCRTVHSWDCMPDSNWEPEEREHIRRIREQVGKHEKLGTIYSVELAKTSVW
jgi:hypothetical protein